MFALLSTGLARGWQILDCSSSDDPIRPRHHLRRNREAELLGSFEVDDQLELRRLLDREVAGFRAFEDLVHVVAARRNMSVRSGP